MHCECWVCVFNLFNHRLVLPLCFSSLANYLQEKLGHLSIDFPALSVFAKSPPAAVFVMFLCVSCNLVVGARGLVRLHFKIKLVSYCTHQFCVGLSLTVTS